MDDDLRQFVSATGPFASVVLPTPSNVDDARHRLDVNMRNAVAAMGEDWPQDRRDELEAVVGELRHGGGEALVVLQAADGTTMSEFLDAPVAAPETSIDPVPRLAVILEARQRARAHVVVEIDRAGADIHAFDGGRVLGTDHVDGDTTHIHRGHPGGWSQRRFQQRAENTWERNADDVATAVTEVVERVGAEKVFVAGDVRAQSLLFESLPHRVLEHTVKVEAGSPEGIAAEVATLMADHVAREMRELAEQVRERVSAGTASTDVDAVLDAVAAGRVEHLLVRDDGSDDPRTGHDIAGVPAGSRVCDAAIIGALRSDSAVTVVPMLALLEGPVAALLRW